MAKFLNANSKFPPRIRSWGHLLSLHKALGGVAYLSGVCDVKSKKFTHSKKRGRSAAKSHPRFSTRSAAHRTVGSQTPRGEQTRTLHRLEKGAKRGRSPQLRPTMRPQRPRYGSKKPRSRNRRDKTIINGRKRRRRSVSPNRSSSYSSNGGSPDDKIRMVTTGM